MFLMLELMAMMFVIMFSIVHTTKREVELVERECEIEQLREEIRWAENQLEYLEMMQKSLQDSEK